MPLKLEEIAENWRNKNILSKTAFYPRNGSLCPENGNFCRKTAIFVPTIKNRWTAQEEAAAFGMMNIEMNNDRLHLLSIYDFDCRQIKSPHLVCIDSRGLPEKKLIVQ